MAKTLSVLRTEPVARFGEELRDERERRNVTLDTICAMTKVSVRHLEALEEGRLRELPGGVFRKGIVRSYLVAVGLEEIPWIERFENALREIGAEASSSDDWMEFAENVHRNRGAGRSNTSNRWIGVAIMVVMVLALGWTVWRFVLHGRVFL